MSRLSDIFAALETVPVQPSRATAQRTEFPPLPGKIHVEGDMYQDICSGDFEFFYPSVFNLESPQSRDDEDDEDDGA